MKAFPLLIAFGAGVLSAVIFVSILANPVAPKVTHTAGITNVLYIAPPTVSRFYISPHAPSELKELGDKDGIDYIPAQFLNGQLRAFRSGGNSNEDFFGFGMDVRAPISGTIIKVKRPNGINPIGKMGTTEVGFVAIKSDEGAILLLAHLAEIKVAEGKRVSVGESIGVLSNNGSSRNPHIHLGAYRKGHSLVIEFDRKALDATLAQCSENESDNPR